ncbi:MAG: D-aminoacyl-tRNA deacylase [Anaerolineae bacterium]|jgi:D-tyrosyl-tRNA(Tyr) deacylase
MRALIQRVTKGSVTVNDERIGEIGPGLVILLGVRQEDTEDDAAWLAQKIAHLRIFEDDEGRFNRSLLDTEGEALVVSQFTLYGNARRGRRPSFSQAAAPEIAEPLVERFCALLQEQGVRRVDTGRFGAMMMVEIHNHGPVTLMLDTDVSRRGNPRA